jgi:acetoin utilization deacetylase AcuC-like enzyme
MAGGELARVIRRRARLALRLFSPARAKLVYDSRYRSSISGLPLDAHRADQILSFLEREGLARAADVVAPEAVSLRALALVHADAFLDSLYQPGVLTSILGVEVGEHDYERVLQLQRLMVGGTIEAVRLALSQGVIGINLGGGFHHARPNRGAGFCVFNDLAVAVQTARVEGFCGRVLVIDCDLHDGDGTRIAFCEDPTVHTFSVHNETWDERPAVESTSIELGPNVEDEEYLRVLNENLPPLFTRFAPELVVYVAGADVASDDRIGNWKISAQALCARDRLVFSLTRGSYKKIPLAIVLAGGYGGQAWRYHARMLGLAMIDRCLEPPSSTEATLARYRYLAELVRADKKSAHGKSDWNLSETDMAGTLGYSQKNPRFLDYYERYSVELALERYGLMDDLRALGFANPHMEIEIDAQIGHTMRIFSSEHRAELLIELRLTRDRGTLPKFELLRVEWLLLQNPRAAFTPERPQLPGQNHPGLGLMEEVAGMLIVVCEQLHLDGVAFATTNYHLAYATRGYLYFLSPEAEARFLAIREAAATFNLAETSWAVAEGRVIDVSTGEVISWDAFPLIMPATAALKYRLANPRRWRETTRLAQALHYRIVPKVVI